MMLVMLSDDLSWRGGWLVVVNLCWLSVIGMLLGFLNVVVLVVG